MALSILRIGVRNPKGLLERSAVAMQLVKNTNFENTRNLQSDSYVCTPFACWLVSPEQGNSSVREYSKQVKRQAEKRLSESESDSDNESGLPGRKGETDFWRRKIRTFHSILDVNNDGVISFDDFKLLADKFVNLGHLSEESSKEFHDVIKTLWEKQWGEITPYNLVTVEQYLHDMYHVVNDKNLIKKADSFLPYLFKAVDKDQSGEICLEEFKLFFECLGLKEEDAEISFKSIDSNGDGKITLKEFVKHGRDFFISEDETRVSKYFWGPLVKI